MELARFISLNEFNVFSESQVQVVSKLPSDNHLIPATPPNQPCLLMSLPQQLQLNWNVKKEIDEKIESYPLRETSTQREEYERQLKDFIDRNTVRKVRIYHAIEHLFKIVSVAWL